MLCLYGILRHLAGSRAKCGSKWKTICKYIWYQNCLGNNWQRIEKSYLKNSYLNMELNGG